MSNIETILESLQPYLISIRYLEGTPILDVVFKENWVVPEDDNIKRIKGGDATINYYMIFSEVPGVGLDNLLNYVKTTIVLNKNRETKHELLRVKINELKEVFKNNSLSNLTNLKFTFSEENLLPEISDLDNKVSIKTISEPVISPVYNINEEGMSQEDLEMLEEERRGEINRKVIEDKKKKSSSQKITTKIELPIKRKPEMVTTERDYETDCNCSEGQACEKCIDSKGY